MRSLKSLIEKCPPWSRHLASTTYYVHLSHQKSCSSSHRTSQTHWQTAHQQHSNPALVPPTTLAPQSAQARTGTQKTQMVLLNLHNQAHRDASTHANTLIHATPDNAVQVQSLEHGGIFDHIAIKGTATARRRQFATILVR